MVGSVIEIFALASFVLTLVLALATVWLAFSTHRLARVTTEQAKAAAAQANATATQAGATARQAEATATQAKATAEQVETTKELLRVQFWPMLVPCDPLDSSHESLVGPPPPVIPLRREARRETNPLVLKNVGNGPALNIALAVTRTYRYAQGPPREVLGFEETDGGNIPAGGECKPTSHSKRIELCGDPNISDPVDIVTVEYSSADGRHFATKAVWTQVGWRDVEQYSISERHPRIKADLKGL